MSEPFNQKQPYLRLGKQLKQLREKLHESIAEVSGAVEIDDEVLVRIEKGEYCPSEDVLLLLFNHFDTEEDEAVRLWEMAGYDKQNMPQDGIAFTGAPDDMNSQKQPIVMVMQQDTRILYSDAVNVTANGYGVVMNFLQNNGQPDTQMNVISRIGMSREHAESIIKVLQHTLKHSQVEPKALPKPRKKPQQD